MIDDCNATDMNELPILMSADHQGNFFLKATKNLGIYRILILTCLL